MAKSEFINIYDALNAVDDRINELRKDKQFTISKLIDVFGVERHFFEYHIFTEQEIVKPYLDKLKEIFEEYRDELNRFESRYEAGMYDTYNSCIDKIVDMIENLSLEEK